MTEDGSAAALAQDRDDREDEGRVSIDGRLWRMEQRQLEITTQLTTVRSRQDEAARKDDEWRYRTEAALQRIAATIDTISKGSNGGGRSKMYEFVIVALLGAFVAVAAGKALNIAGLLG